MENMNTISDQIPLWRDIVIFPLSALLTKTAVAFHIVLLVVRLNAERAGAALVVPGVVLTSRGQ